MSGDDGKFVDEKGANTLKDKMKEHKDTEFGSGNSRLASHN